MGYIRTRPTQKDIDNSFFALDVMSGKKTKESDYEAYTLGKQKLYKECTSLVKYDMKLAKLIVECNL